MAEKSKELSGCCVRGWSPRAAAVRLFPGGKGWIPEVLGTAHPLAGCRWPELAVLVLGWSNRWVKTLPWPTCRARAVLPLPQPAPRPERCSAIRLAITAFLGLCLGIPYAAAFPSLGRDVCLRGSGA